MKQIVINGNKTLSGKIKIGGAKNSAVALLPATMLTNKTAVIHNVPSISDRKALLDILEYLGAKIESNKGTYTFDMSNTTNKPITLDYSKKLRASYYFMGVLLAKYKKAEVYMPGGCEIGARPIDFHLEGFEALGATITQDKEKYTIEAEELVGADIKLDFASVGATKNIMFASVYAKGTTRIINAAREVEVINIGKFLISMGAKITGLGTDTITIEGVSEFTDGEISVISDRIEGGTYIIIGALLGDNLCIEGFDTHNNEALLNYLDQMNVPYKLGDNNITLSKATSVNPVDIKTEVYPGFPTDLGQPMQILMTQANGISHFTENIYENRMGHIDYLNMMGAGITNEVQCATFSGPKKLKGNKLAAVDLRGGAALVIAGLIAEGTTTIDDIKHILRGYEKIIKKLSSVGADIEIKDI